MARGWHCTKLSVSSALLYFSGMCFVFSKKNLNASRPSEHPPQSEEKISKRLVGGIMGCKYKTSSWHWVNNSMDAQTV